MRQTRVVAMVVLLGMMNGMLTRVSAQRQVAAGAKGARTSVADALLRKLVTITLTRVPLSQAVDAIAAQAGVVVSYRREVIASAAQPVTVRVVQVSLGDVFARVLAGTALQLVPLADGQFSIVPAVDAPVRAQSGVITGKVTDSKTKQPLHGVKVALDDVDRAITGEDGMYRVIGVDAGTHKITVKLLGYGKAVRIVTVADGITAAVDVMLELSTNVLEQVVVTGTVIPTELKALPNAITVITSKQIEERGITKIDQLFRGDVPGLFAQNQGSGPGVVVDQVIMFSRGATALSDRSAGTSLGTNPIKTYVDGVEMADPQYLSQIDPRSIERIEILTGPQASTIYGSNALNGVIQIFTKRGTTSTPQLTLNLLSGWIENNFSAARTPQHSYNAQLTGVDGRLSYNAGGSWDYTGRWTPARKSTRTGGFGGIRGEWHTPVGLTTADVTLRRTVTQDLEGGSGTQTSDILGTNGYLNSFLNTVGRVAPRTNKLDGQTFAITLGYHPTSWWSHDVSGGQDAEALQMYKTDPAYSTGGSDTTLEYFSSLTTRRSVRYTTTAQAPMLSLANITATFGADAWQSLMTSQWAQPLKLTGTLDNVIEIIRRPDHNAGGFFQTQLSIHDKVFMTYGLRAEWNPGFGQNVRPNLAPRYGIAATQELGTLTAKLRASYGRSTRPPHANLVAGGMLSQVSPGDDRLTYYGDYWYFLPNQNLLPEHKQGGEGGLEFYWGNAASLVVTRYNETVDNLIEEPQVDSVPSLQTLAQLGYDPSRFPQWPGGYLYGGQFQAVNIGSIRDQGWELQSSVNIGPFIAKGTYSFTKSRVLGITSAFRAKFPARTYPQYQPGATFLYLAEHTWGTGITYAHRGTNVALNINGIGQLFTNYNSQFSLLNLNTSARLPMSRYRMSLPSKYKNVNNGYAMADLNATQHFFSNVDGILQIQNLSNYYANDFNAQFASIGRQTKIGARIRM